MAVKEHAVHGLKITKEHAEQVVNQKLLRNGPRLYVFDVNNIQNTKLVEHFVKTLEIKGLGRASILKLGIMKPNEIFGDVDWDRLGANGAKIKEQLDIAKTKPYHRVLAAFGIPGVGLSTARLITAKLPNFYNLQDIKNTEIKGIGKTTIDAIINWLNINRDWVEKLPLQLVEEVNITRLVEQDAKKICLTGKIDMSRTEFKTHLELLGFKVTTTVTKDCYALISGGDTESTKYKKAIQTSVPIIDYWKNKVSILKGEF